MTMSAPARPARMSVKTSTPIRSMPVGQQRRRPDDADPRAEDVEEEDVGARDAAVGDVAADRHRQPLDAALVAADGERVEERLGRVLVGAVAGIDHRAAHLLGKELDRAGGVVADDQDVRPHGVERHRRVDERLALLHRRVADRHVHDVGAEALAGELEGGLGAGGGFEEEVDLRPAAQDRLLLLDLAADFDRLLRRGRGGRSISPAVMPSMPNRCRCGKVSGGGGGGTFIKAVRYKESRRGGQAWSAPRARLDNRNSWLAARGREIGLSSADDTHEVFNQSPPFAGVNLFTSDPGLGALVEGLPQAVIDRLTAHGEALGLARRPSSSAGIANVSPPVAPDPRSERRAHRRRRVPPGLSRADAAERRRRPACLDLGRRRRPRRACGASPAPRALYMTAQAECGHVCPMTMTSAAVAALAHAPDLANVWLPKIRSRQYDSSQPPASPRRRASPSAWA